jgi:hypothetical protein
VASQAPFGNDPAKIERYRAFWSREDVDRPLVGFSFKTWLPMDEYAASRAWQSADYLTPDMVHPEEFLDDQERLLREGEIVDDDVFRGASPSQAVPWMQSMFNFKLRILPSSILGEDRAMSWEELEDIHLDHDHPWVRKYIEFAETLVRRSAGRFPVSHGTLHGPSDMVAGMRGHNRCILDLVDEPEKASQLLWRCGGIFREITESVWEHIPLFHGGYYDAQYQLWSPGSIIRMQEDATALYSPDLYRRFVQPIDRDLARSFACSFIHLHSTSMFILDAFLEVEEIRCFEVNYDVSGPSLEAMIPYYRMIQRAERPLLIRGSFTPDEARLLMDSLEPRGLYLYIMVSSIEEIETLRPLIGM